MRARCRCNKERWSSEKKRCNWNGILWVTIELMSYKNTNIIAWKSFFSISKNVNRKEQNIQTNGPNERSAIKKTVAETRCVCVLCHKWIIIVVTECFTRFAISLCAAPDHPLALRLFYFLYSFGVFEKIVVIAMDGLFKLKIIIKSVYVYALTTPAPTCTRNQINTHSIYCLNFHLKARICYVIYTFIPHTPAPP